MLWLEYIRTFWPIAVVILPLVVAIGFMWLKTQFPTKNDVKAVEATIKGDVKAVEISITAKIDGHEERLRDGSRKLAELDKRVAIVEDDCDSQPSKNDLNQGLAVLAGRLSGVESSLKGVERQLGTQHDYLRTIIDQGLRQ